MAALGAAALAAFLWWLIEAAPIAIAELALTTAAVAAWLRRWKSGGSDWLAAPVLAVVGLALNLALLLIAASHGE